MAFVETWVETDPDGAVITGSLLDDYQRQAKRALRERLEGDPTNMNSGIFESGSFAGTAIVRAGTARAYAVAAAGLAALTLQDGRLAITTDTNRLYHLKGSGIVEVAYAPAGGSTGPWVASKLSLTTTSTFGSTLTVGAQVYGDATYGAVLAGFGSTSDFALVIRDGTVALRSVGATAALLTGGAFTSSGVLTASAGATILGGINPNISFNDGTGLGYVQVVAGAINLASRTGAHTVSGSLSVSGLLTVTGANIAVDSGAGIAVSGTLRLQALTTGVAVTGSLTFPTATSFVQGSMQRSSASGLIISAPTGGGSTYDFAIYSGSGIDLIAIPTGTNNLKFNPGGGTSTFSNTVTISAGGFAVTGTSSVVGTLSVSNTVTGVLNAVGTAVDPRVLICRTDNVAGNFATLLLGTNNPGFYANNAFIRAMQGSGIDSWQLHFGASNTGSGGAASQLMTLDVGSGVQHHVKASFDVNVTLGANAGIANGRATVSVSTGVATTVGTITVPTTTPATYLVTVSLPSATTASSGYMIVTYSAGQAPVWFTGTAVINGFITALSIDASGNIRVTQSGATINVTTSWVKLA